MDRGAWWATVHRVAKSRTRLSDSAQSTAEVRVSLLEVCLEGGPVGLEGRQRGTLGEGSRLALDFGLQCLGKR